MMYRTFGVEIECGHAGRTYSQIENSFRRHGFRIGWLNGWSFSNDGSGIEAKTPILSGPAGFQELRKGMKYLVSLGCWVSAYDGMHVHHGVPELDDDADLAARLVDSWQNNIKLIENFVARRRHRNGACPHWTPSAIDALKEKRHGDIYYRYGPRGSLNLRSFSDYGTVELRLHEGCLDIQQAEAWVRFGQHFINSVVNRKSPICYADSSEKLLKKIRMGQRATKRLLEKPRDPNFRIRAERYRSYY